MRSRPITRSQLAARTLAASACALLLAAAPAAAVPAYDVAPRPTTAQPAPQPTPRPTIVKETVIRHNGVNPGPVDFALLGTTLVAALLGAGYLGARITAKTINPHPN
jgi:hypothetical protein